MFWSRFTGSVLLMNTERKIPEFFLIGIPGFG